MHPLIGGSSRLPRLRRLISSFGLGHPDETRAKQSALSILTDLKRTKRRGPQRFRVTFVLLSVTVSTIVEAIGLR